VGNDRDAAEPSFGIAAILSPQRHRVTEKAKDKTRIMIFFVSL
jgi:hypothetical protein